MQPIHLALSTLFTQFFYQVQDPLKTAEGLSAFSAVAGIHSALLTPAMAWQLLQQPTFVKTLPSAVSEWLKVLDALASLSETTESDAELIMALRVFWMHGFAWQLPHLTQDISIPLITVYNTGHFADPRVLVALFQHQTQPPATTPATAPQNLSSAELNTAYAHAAAYFHAYRLKTPLHLAGWCHGLALALAQHPPATPTRSNILHPFLVNALKACWNDSEQQRLFVQHWLQAMPKELPLYQPFRQVYATFMKARKNLDQIRRTQDQLYVQWQHTEPLKPLIQEALQKSLHQGQVGSVFVFVRHDQSYTPLALQHIPYAYRQEAGQWRWRSYDSFSQNNARDQHEKRAHQQLQQTLNTIYQHSSTQHTGLSGSKTIQSRWWSAGDALLIAALHARSQAVKTSDLHASPDMLGCQDPILQQVFADACERIACEHRAGLVVSEALRKCCAQLYDHLYDHQRAETKDPFQRICEALLALPLSQVEHALASLSKDSLALYLCWAYRQTGGVPIDGFCQPLMYEHDGQQSVPAVMLWGEVHRLPLRDPVLPFISRLHMHEIVPISDLMGHWANDELLHWRQDLNRLREQQQRQDEDYQRIQRAFENIRQCREKENLAWAELRNQLDPPELLAYGVASNYALQQAYTRLHRPDQIHSPTALLCFLADLSTGAQHQTLILAEDTLTQLQLRAPDSLLAEIFDYWRALPQEEQTLATAQALFNYCKIIIYDGSQIESQLPGVLSLMQIVHTLHRMAKYADTLGKKHQRQLSLPLQITGEAHRFDRSAQLHLRRILQNPELQSALMGMPLTQLQDTHTLFPCFALGKEQLALGFMDCLYALYTTHFSPILQNNGGSDGSNETPEHPCHRLWVQALHLHIFGSSNPAGFQLRLVLSGVFSQTARQKIEQLSQLQGVQHPLPPTQTAHDLRRVLHRLRENLDIPVHHPWFVEFSETQAHQRGVYFCETVGQDNYTTLVVNLPL